MKFYYKNYKRRKVSFYTFFPPDNYPMIFMCKGSMKHELRKAAVSVPEST